MMIDVAVDDDGNAQGAAFRFAMYLEVGGVSPCHHVEVMCNTYVLNVVLLDPC